MPFFAHFNTYSIIILLVPNIPSLTAISQNMLEIPPSVSVIFLAHMLSRLVGNSTPVLFTTFFVGKSCSGQVPPTGRYNGSLFYNGSTLLNKTQVKTGKSIDIR